MAALVEEICDPERFKLNHAIKMARTGALSAPGFEIAIVRYLESNCLSRSAAMTKVFRGLEVLEGMLGGNPSEENRLVTLLRPFLRSGDPVIASKCVLILGRRSRSVALFRRIMEENDYRIRANLIEALWRRDEPEVRQLLLKALEDPHQRVIANAAFGLFLLDVPAWTAGLEKLLNSRHPVFRASGIWLLRTAAPADALERVGKFIRDPDPRVKRAAFDALVKLRRSESLAWLGGVMGEEDYRIRADLVEALWGRDQPEIRELLLQAVRDPHPRVIANAAYGLFLLEGPEWLGGLEMLLNSDDPVFRKSGIWLLTTAAPADAARRIGKLIRDPDPQVKRAAFEALATLGKRERGDGSVAEPADGEVSAAVPSADPRGA
jgi:HEAT repeat protein